MDVGTTGGDGQFFEQNFLQRRSKLDGYVNIQSCSIWGSENPQVFTEMPLHSGKPTIWLALWSEGVSGP